MKEMITGQSSSKKSSQTAATEAADTIYSKSYARIIDLLGSGEWDTVCIGGLKGLYVDDVPAQNADGTNNVTGITLETRTGTLDQTAMDIADTVEASVAVSVKVLKDVPVEQSVANTNTDTIRVIVAVPALTTTDTTTGNVTGGKVQYKLEWKSYSDTSWTVVPSLSSTTVSTALAYNESVQFTAYSGYVIKYNIYPARYSTGIGTVACAPCAYTVEVSLDNGTTWAKIANDTTQGDLSATVTYPTYASAHVKFRITTQTVASFVPVGPKITDSYYSVSSLNGTNPSDTTGTQTISEKFTSNYERIHSFKVYGGAPYLVRLTRITPDSSSEYIKNDLYFQAITSVVSKKFSYPGSVLAGIVVDATQFSSIPSRGYLCKMKKVKIPTNYDPLTRVYTGFWDGSFKVSWSDNPAWCFYDLLTDKYNGLGDRIPESYIDKGSLYQIAKYCDELVLGDNNQYEPRFTCNLYIQDRREAYKVITDMANIFRGITYWGNGMIVPVQDRLRDPSEYSTIYTNANVEDGAFQYQSSDLSTRYNAVAVTWNDPNNLYKSAVEWVADEALISSLGYLNQTTYTALGCTSRSMARRVGRWLLYTNNYLTDVVSFTTGMDGAIPTPGDVIKVSDIMRSSDRRGGRILHSTVNVASTSVTIDSPITFNAGSAYTLSLIDATGNMQDFTIQFSNTTTTDTVTLNSTVNIAKDSVFVVASNDVPITLWSVTDVKEKDTGNSYEVTAVKYDPQKYSYIESGKGIVSDTTAIEYVSPITSITTSEYLYSDGSNVQVDLRVEWPAALRATSYDIALICPDGQRIVKNTRDRYIELAPALEGTYTFNCVSQDILGHNSSKFSKDFVVIGKLAPPSTPTSFTIKNLNGVGTANWGMAPDLDVRIGGSVVVKYTDKISNVVWEDGIVVATVDGSITQCVVPLLPGTYTCKFVDSGGRYSQGFAQTNSFYAEVEATNVMATLDEAAANFPGTKVHCRASSGMLVLSNQVLWDEVTNVDSITQTDNLGIGVTTSLTADYTFSDVIDLTDVYTVRLYGTVSGFSAVDSDTINSRLNPFDTWSRFDGDRINDSTIQLYISTTTDDPRAANAVWSDYSVFILGDYTARGFRFKLHIERSKDEYSVYVDKLSVSVDAVDRVVAARNVDVPATGFSVVFDGAFSVTPAIAISIDNLQTGDYYRLTSKSASGFTAQIFDSTNTPVARKIDFIVKGYGIKR